ncbi:hypothetical protein C8J57DRAFT_1459186 [Mycena rebaudengoi]|nr:hypothetical protein C8J57DRAFT_1459186 [Mycena rebaudengoi]
MNQSGLDDSFTPAGEALFFTKDRDMTVNRPHVAPKVIVAETELDLLGSIKGMFRVLDLISEIGSGGLVDKIIIAQESLKEFINALSPGAYASIIKVDFKALDNLKLKPLGLYGSKTEIVAFLSSRNAIDDDTAQALLLAKDNTTGPQLRSGLYILRTCSELPGPEQIFVLYWPEATTWNDDAISSVKRNRVTFMRYLTKICDQVTCLISPEHARAIVWTEEEEPALMDIDEGSDRLFTFQVAKTNEQEEGVTVRPGFILNNSILSVEKLHVECLLDAAELQPTLIRGETAQAILTKHFVPAKFEEREIRDKSFSPVKLKDLLAQGSIRLSPSLSDDGITILMENGLQSRFSEPFKAWKSRNESAKQSLDSAGRQEEEEANKKLNDDAAQMEPMLREIIVDRLLLSFPTVQRTVLSSVSEEDTELFRAQYANFVSVHSKVQTELEKLIPGQSKLSPKFQSLKEKLIYIIIVLHKSANIGADYRAEVIKQISENGFEGTVLKGNVTATEARGVWARMTSFFSDEQPIYKRVAGTTDAELLACLDEILAAEPLLQPIITQAVEAANDHLQSCLTKAVKTLVGKSVLVQQETLKMQIQRRYAGKLEDQRKSSRLQLIEEYERGIIPSFRELLFERVEHAKHTLYTSFKVSGRDRSRTEPTVQHEVHVLRLTTDDQHVLQLNPSFVPSPHLRANSAQIFNVAIGHRILHAQLLNSGKLLLIIENPELLLIFLETPSALANAISRGRSSAKRVFHRDKIGKDLIIAYDEQKRMLSLCASSKLHIYMFDENSSLQAWGGVLDLSPWYTPGTHVCQSCFVSGCEEILFIDTSEQARIFSLITQQFRPASLSLDRTPSSIYSSPDGACLVLAFRDSDGLSFRTYHWSTFGSSQGIDLGKLDIPDGPMSLTSLVNRRNVHLVSVDVDNRRCQSVVFDITKKTTEFMFKETGKSFSKSSTITTAHNSLIDCHADVWTRFPVVAAVQRTAIVSSVDRKARKLVFITDRNHDKYLGNFSELIHSFEQRTRKPTGDVLKNIQVLALDSKASFFGEPVSWWSMRCLPIPRRRMACRPTVLNSYPDRCHSRESFFAIEGWGVFGSSRTVSSGGGVLYDFEGKQRSDYGPVKVVSSMGEQSVGKSFALNHLVDTSFAGSAMRTTEGVWMSVTPTDSALVVSLDFEGVHSIERSAQEDTLLVLFNTAISNLSSSTVLDPVANPTLFRSTLTIIIKDVVESDKNEIVKEFSTKFQKIVKDEQDANFISRLHAGQLNIVPWPVIESKQFYQLFPAVKRLLDKQEVTHRTAGEFLHTLKTLMAKLKVVTGGVSIYLIFPAETLVAHRAHKLLSGLNTALAVGFYEVEPDGEPLKNFDTDELIEKPDTDSQFFLSSTETPSTRREEMLVTLQNSWTEFGNRPYKPDTEWAAGLSAYLDGLAELRIRHVHKWISSNLSRFTSSHANIDMLRRVFETTIVDLRANVEICGTQCASCQLKCLLSRRHDSITPHNCRTSHQCPHICDFGDEHPTVEKSCGLPGGHAGRHICAVDIHLCGEPCGLKDKQGCLGNCMKIAGHPDTDYMCSARLHKCGEACDLKNVGTEKYSCLRACTIPWDEPHRHHVCDTSACPMVCQLCKRLCSDPDHLHGLQTGSVHLCGQVHNCHALCQAAGICEIDTAPQSIQAIFTGRHETFQYTKYSQVANRLPCVLQIPPGELTHSGPHSHSTDPVPFHFCETRCDSCQYFCTLPRGHSQREHETHHGSMSKTRWAVDGPEGTALELNGRKFASDDDGAPMMCNLVCQDMGRHVHVDYCRADNAASCDGPEVQHISAQMTPQPARAKDWVSHSLFWRRTGFRGT